ncbi:Heme exporter protein A [Alcanivorax venustensis ISO4]|jgi:heme exporter protein A|uniref:Heme exporter protein A n=2 Tax=Alloalcanivorax venustensis TaxID=172371 RepID=A0ABS0AHX0_9GAMM|nr:Heme exporter protein A [Alloalcanivorax venustensis ISO4]|tara:strand:+ start:5140 stop:5691 length:552 start_codon:yes stop_codon:yes gene_type:complete
MLFENLDFSARNGEIWQVTGANGAGKTTLLRILVGLHGFYQGRVEWSSPLPPSLLYLGHQPGVREELTARENLEYNRALSGQTGDPDAALAALDLYGFEDVPAGRLSAGQQRRIALARLWLDGKDVWILDEPFTAIDQQGVAALDQRLRQAAAQGVLVIYTSHHRVGDGVHRLHLGEDREVAR